MNPVDDPAGRAIDALLTATLAGIRKDPKSGAGLNPGPSVNALLEQVHGSHGWAGIYRLALGCARIAADGLTPHTSDERRGEAPFLYFGSAGEPQPETPVGYRISRFVVALMQGDEAAAWLEFTRWQPDDTSGPSPEMREALWHLLARAWNRQAGAPLIWQIAPGERWPPECDFCCAATAQQMFRCRPFEMGGASKPGEMGSLRTVYTDIEYWYACRICAVAVNADDWAAVWRRYLIGGPDRGSDNVRRLWESFRKNRRPKTYRLPRTRPTPMPGDEGSTR